ncbi:hypothetical protein JTB14_023409 [Gonioctena quinquepunctata]|nr:hypothetical protein JTB14_023409 [Gonioctena quinquepunctata]
MLPIFLDDFWNGDKPQSLKNMLTHLENTEANVTRLDILVGLIYILMLENGFVPKESNEDSGYENKFDITRMLEHSKILPSGWKKQGVYVLPFKLPTFDTNECRIACYSLGDDFVINCVVKGIENGHFCTCLDPLTYYSSASNSKIFNLQNIRRLSAEVKNAICFPAKQSILLYYNIKVCCLEALPTEMIILITEYLDTIDLIHFGMTCRKFHAVSKLTYVWIRRIEKDFEMKLNDNTRNLDYRELVNIYKKRWLRQLRMRCVRWLFRQSQSLSLSR